MRSLLAFDTGTAEVKRLYSRSSAAGVGKAILGQLEGDAAASGYRKMILETRAINHRAIRFYERNGFTPIQPYGAYVGQFDARCFEKLL
jgi:ribosomal protein S18 acetylase RimI-like enzyme